MISANDFISLYMGLELQSLSLYVLASMKKDSNKSSEAGLKYFILGALASGFFLFGVSLLFGIAGTTAYTELSLILVNYENYSPLLALAIVMILCSIAFKLSAAPFHMWTPDVYEGSPTTVTAFIAVVPKIAAVAIIVRVLYIPFGNIYEIWYQILIMISVASIYVGAFGALVQDNIKRLMAYSTIGSIGYVLLALSAGSQEALQGALIYITIYTISVMGSFVAIVFMEKDNIALEKISDLAGISKTDPYTAICFSILLLSLAGLPPFAGFVGKFYIFRSLIIEDLTWLAVIGVIGSVIAAYYYLKLIKIMYLDNNMHSNTTYYSYNS
jgi:NADH-quinone oxidoreductase subunit N